MLIFVGPHPQVFRPMSLENLRASRTVTGATGRPSWVTPGRAQPAGPGFSSPRVVRFPAAALPAAILAPRNRDYRVAPAQCRKRHARLGRTRRSTRHAPSRAFRGPRFAGVRDSANVVGTGRLSAGWPRWPLMRRAWQMDRALACTKSTIDHNSTNRGVHCRTAD